MKDFMYIPDVAARLGTTEAQVRSALQRRSDAVPPPTRLGRRIAFRVKDYEAWLETKAPTRSRGRPRSN